MGHLLHTGHGPALHLLTHLIVRADLSGRVFGYFPHFTGVKMERLKMSPEGTGPARPEMGFKPRQAGSRSSG